MQKLKAMAVMNQAGQIPRATTMRDEQGSAERKKRKGEKRKGSNKSSKKQHKERKGDQTPSIGAEDNNKKLKDRQCVKKEMIKAMPLPVSFDLSSSSNKLENRGTKQPSKKDRKKKSNVQFPMEEDSLKR